MTGPRLRWTRGGEAEIVAIAGETISLRSTVPWPPGARVDGTLVDDARGAFRVKVHACRKRADREYVIDGRGLDWSKELRTLLESALPPG